MGKKYGTIITIGILTVSCFILGLIGLLQSTRNDNSQIIDEYKIKYTYYVDGSEVKELPVNTTKTTKDYIFNRYSCTNKVTGEWNEFTWKFVPKTTNTATCKLYFNKAYYSVKFEIEYGELRNADGSVIKEEDKLKDPTVEREKNLIAKIEPNEGYSLVSVDCDKKNVTDWDKENNELTVKAVKADTKCVVKFDLSKYDVEVKVTGGTINSTGETKLTIEHGKSVNVTVSPNTNYVDPKIECTNNQKGTWNNNKFTIEKLEKETSCTIEFKLKSYNVTVNVDHGKATPSKAPININGSKNFKITADPGYIITGGYGVEGCSDNFEFSGGELVFKVTNVTSELTCNITLAKEPETTTTPTTSTTQP